jgi:XTP/dITP diphosphohydrolase
MLPPRLLVATNNAHKVLEFRRLLADLPTDLLTPADLGISLDVVEDGSTFRDNASLKAHAFAKASGLPSLADDSGIEVDALDGGPGVLSARYGGPGLSDDDRLQLLLTGLKDVPEARRTCRYRVVLALAELDGTEQATEGICEGRVTHAPVGSNGFGYDPVFFVPSYGKTIAQLDPSQKDEISHRGKAARAMAALLAPDTR